MKIKNSLFLGLVLLMFCFVIPAQATNLPTGHQAMYYIDNSGVYNLVGDVSMDAGGILVLANDVVIDGHNFNMTYSNTSSAKGISVTGYNNITIQNINIISTGNTYTGANGIYLNNTHSCVINNVNISTNKSTGCYILNSQNLSLSNSDIISNSSLAIMLGNITIGTLDANYCYSATYDALHLLWASNNIDITNSLFESVSGNGSMLSASYNNTVQNCTFNSTSSNGLLLLAGSNNNTFSDISAHSVSGLGVQLENANDNTFSRFTITGATVGIRLPNSHRNTFSDIYLNAPDASTPHASNHIMTMGDSITQGSNDGNSTYQSYMQTSLPEWYISNRGICGETSTQGYMRFEQELDIFNPTVVTIMYGANDIRTVPEQTIIDNVIAMAVEADSRGIIPYIMLTPSIIDVDSDIASYNTNLSKAAHASGFMTINVYDVIDVTPSNGMYDGYNASMFIADGIHPNNAANVLIGQHIARQLFGLSQLHSGVGLSQTIGLNGEILFNSREIYSTDMVIPFSIIPTEDWVRVNITTWETNYKVWTEDMDDPDGTTAHVIGGFPANTDIDIYRDGIDYDTVTSNASGYITWVYNGGFSEHEFEAIPHATAGMRDSFVDSWGNTVSMVGAIIVIALAGSAIAVFRGKREVTDLVNDLPGIVLIVVLLVTGAIIFGQF